MKKELFAGPSFHKLFYFSSNCESFFFFRHHCPFFRFNLFFSLFKLNLKLQLCESTARRCFLCAMLPFHGSRLFVLHHQRNQKNPSRKFSSQSNRSPKPTEDTQFTQTIVFDLAIIVISFNYRSPRIQEIQHKHSQLLFSPTPFLRLH